MVKQSTRAWTAAKVARALQDRGFVVLRVAEANEDEDGIVCLPNRVSVQVGLDGLLSVNEVRGEGDDMVWIEHCDATSFIEVIDRTLRTALPAKPLRVVKWSFDGGEVYDGFTNDTYWNGFLNVWVTAETHKKVLADCDTNLGETGLDEIKPDADGLYDYSCGFATQEVGMRPVWFILEGDDRSFEGLVDDSGNLYVTPDVHLHQIEQHLGIDWENCGYDKIKPDARGNYPYVGIAWSEAGSNEALMEAAPALLAALRGLIPLIEEHASEIADEVLKDARAAIKRATSG